MWQVIGESGSIVVAVILGVANVLVRDEAAPGFVAIGLVFALVVFSIWFVLQVSRSRRAVNWLRKQIQSRADVKEFSQQIDTISAAIRSESTNKYRRQLAAA